jgi:hypothetical protein
MLGANREVDDSAMDRARETPVEQGRGAHHHARANEIECALERVGADQQYREGDQGRHAPAGQDPVVDLEHVERAGEHQQIDDAREHGHPRKLAPAFAQRGGELRMKRSARGEHG